MENKTNLNTEQILTLKNRNNLIVGGTLKIISLKPDLIQLDTIQGGLQIFGENLELTKLDTNSTAEIIGIINGFKFLQSNNKESIFRKLFK